MSNPQTGIPQYLGFAPTSPNGGFGTYDLSDSFANNKALAFGFTPDAARTITRFKTWCSKTTGTLATTDFVCTIYGDSATTPGSPGTSLGSSTAIGSVPASTGAWVEWTGLSVALSAGSQYWVVLTNGNATPTANYPTFQYPASWNADLALGYSNQNYGFITKYKNGTSYVLITNTYSPFWRIGFGDGTFTGFPIQAVAQASDQANGSVEPGVKFTLPAGCNCNVKGVAMWAYGNSATGDLKYNLYLGNATTPTASTNAIPHGNVNGYIGYYLAYFASPVALPGGSVVRVTMSDSLNGDTGNYYNYSQLQMDSDSNSAALVPFDGTMQHTKLSGGTWTDTPHYLDPFALVLDTNGEFTASSGGFRHIGMSGGFES